MKTKLLKRLRKDARKEVQIEYIGDNFFKAYSWLHSEKIYEYDGRPDSEENVAKIKLIYETMCRKIIVNYAEKMRFADAVEKAIEIE